MRAVRYVSPGNLEVCDVAEPEPGRGQVIIAVAAAGICGSDLHALTHGFAVKPGAILGHEFSGTIQSVNEVPGAIVGHRVVVRPILPCGGCARCVEGNQHLCERAFLTQIGFASPGAFAEQVLVPRAVIDETVFPLPDTISDEAGALVEPLAVAMHAVRRVAPEPGDVALVLGLGPVGLGVTALLIHAGIGPLVVSDPSPLRRHVALDLGAAVAVDPTRQDPVRAVARLTGRGPFGGARADVAFECAGVEAALTASVSAVRAGGRVGVTAIYPGSVSWPVNRIVEKELSVLGTFAYQDEFRRVIDLLAAGRLDATQLISHRFGLEQAVEAFAVQADAGASLKVLVVPE